MKDKSTRLCEKFPYGGVLCETGQVRRSGLWRDVGDFVGCLTFLAAVVILAWLYLIVTPAQMSGESDLHRQDCEDAGVDYAPAFGKEVR